MPADALSPVFSTRNKQKTCHITVSNVNYNMTWLTTNNKCLNQVISLKFDWLQNISLTETGHHDNISSKFCPMSSPTLSHFPVLSLVTKLQWPYFQLSHWSQGHMAHYNHPLVHYHSRNLYNLACLHDIKITHYTTKTLLDFLDICFSIHCHTISVLSLYFHVHILHTLYQNLTILEINLSMFLSALHCLVNQ